MQTHIFKTSAQVGQAAATIIAAQLLRKPDSILGLATGSSPVPTYQALIAMHQAGFNQAVASLGTAFTSGQASLLKRYAQRYCFAMTVTVREPMQRFAPSVF